MGHQCSFKSITKEKLNMDQNGIRLEVDAMVENTILTYFTVMETGIRIQQTDLAIQNLEAVIKKQMLRWNQVSCCVQKVTNCTQKPSS